MAVILRADLWKRLESLIYHKDISSEMSERMCEVRQLYIDLAVWIIDEVPGETRSKSLALTHLEDSLMRTIQALALTGTPDVEA